MALLLVVEDDPAIGEPLARVLRREGHEVQLVTDGASALAAAHLADLLVLDLGLPDMDGLEVCRTLRATGSTIPVLVLTARVGEAELVIGLDAGADDYVSKPFRISELSARVRALLRRASPDTAAISVDDIVIDHSRHVVSVAGDEVALTPKEYDLLDLLLQRAGTVVGRQAIMREVWRTEWVGNTKTLDMHVSSLRRKLGPAGARVLTVRGVGLRYQHVADADADGCDDDIDPEAEPADADRFAAPAREQA